MEVGLKRLPELRECGTSKSSVEHYIDAVQKVWKELPVTAAGVKGVDEGLLVVHGTVPGEARVEWKLRAKRSIISPRDRRIGCLFVVTGADGRVVLKLFIV